MEMARRSEDGPGDSGGTETLWMSERIWRAAKHCLMKWDRGLLLLMDLINLNLTATFVRRVQPSSSPADTPGVLNLRSGDPECPLQKKTADDDLDVKEVKVCFVVSAAVAWPVWIKDPSCIKTVRRLVRRWYVLSGSNCCRSLFGYLLRINVYVIKARFGTSHQSSSPLYPSLFQTLPHTRA